MAKTEPAVRVIQETTEHWVRGRRRKTDTALWDHLLVQASEVADWSLIYPCSRNAVGGWVKATP
jgi:hypothetical protein